MVKRILMSICIFFLLAFSVSALKPVGDQCLNDDECKSSICQGGECREADVMNLFPKEVSKTQSTFYVVFITGLLVLIIIILGLWYRKTHKKK